MLKSAAYKEFAEFLHRRQQTLDKDERIEEDTKVMIPYFKLMLLHGVVTFNGQGGYIDAIGRQRPYLEFITPIDSKNDIVSDASATKGGDITPSFINDLISAGYTVLHSQWGLVTPRVEPDAGACGNISENIVYRSCMQFAKYLERFDELQPKPSHALRGNSVDYRISVSESTLSWGSDEVVNGLLEPCTSVPLHDRPSACEVLGHELGAVSEESAELLNDDFDVVTVIDPTWGGDTTTFIESICKAVLVHYERTWFLHQFP